MSTFLEIREKLKLLYSRSEYVLVPVLKFMMAYLALCMVNGKLGYMPVIDNLGMVLVVSLICSFLPMGFVVFFAGVFSLLHFYALSIEVAIVALVIYLVIFLLFSKFAGEHATTMLWTYVLMAVKLPYIVPIAVGLLVNPLASVSVGCGLVAYYFIDNIANNASAIGNMGKEEAISKIRMVIDGLIQNKELLVMLVAFTVTVFVVYIIRRLSVEHAWTIAMVVGAIVNMVILLGGDLMYDTNSPLLPAVLGSLVAVAFGKVLEFFDFCVDYSRTEKVQFEDDEYYYYVKAVPKMNVAATEKTVKHINSQRSSVPATRKPATTERRERGVETERTMHDKREERYQEKVRGKSVTISNDDDIEYYDDI